METGTNGDVSSYMPTIMKRPFTVIRKFGLFSDNKFKRTSSAVFYGFLSFIMIAIAMMQFKGIKGDIYQLAANIETIVGFTQLFAKTVIAAYQQEDYKKLIKTTKHFWNFDKCDKSTRVEMMSIMSLSLKAQKVFVRAVFICAAFAILFSLFGRVPLPVGIWTLEGYDALRRAALIIQVPLVIYSAHLISYFDCMYFAFCTEIIIQFKIFCYHLKHLNVIGDDLQEMEMNYLKKMNICIRQHNFLIRFVTEFQNLYSAPLLMEYCTVAPLICFEFCAAAETANSLEKREGNTLLTPDINATESEDKLKKKILRIPTATRGKTKSKQTDREDRIVELKNVLTEVNLDLLGLCEVRREEEQMVKRPSKAIFYYTDAASGQAGVGFYVNKKQKNRIKKFATVNVRIATLSVEIDRTSCFTIIQVYAPTSNSTKKEIKDFYEALQHTLQNASKSPIEPENQAGFRASYLTIDHLQLIEKSKKYIIPIYLAFIDYTKASDFIRHKAIEETLEDWGIPQKYVNIIKRIYDKPTACIEMDKTGERLNLETGVRLEDLLFPDLFKAVLEHLFRKLDWEEKGVKINDELLNNSRFADAVNIAEIQEQLRND
ncbi:hypothetical protein ILUMI_09638 [Ignelater luminosus]|uniref:Odorant receptor n=1 Tax=Ignelater luminosus TaxID=2038154 RepID=A0A8K0D3U6_IGNLU|nr:hypothetical protein ILUMI_09638 [Ignelater luminosus]